MKKINASDWRVLLLDAIARQMNKEGKMPEPGYMVTCTSSPRSPTRRLPACAFAKPGTPSRASLNSITIYELVPLYANECDFAALYGHEKLLERLQKTNFWPGRSIDKTAAPRPNGARSSPRARSAR